MTTTLRTTRSRNQPGASSTAAAAAVANSGLALVTNGLTGRAAGGGAAEKDGEKEGAAAGRDKSQQQGRRVIRLRTRGGGGPQREPPAASLLENGGDNSPILDKKEGQEKQEEREEEEMKLYERWAEEYYEIVEQLPLELHRTFALMRELETKMQSKIQFMASHTIAYRDARLSHKSRQGGEKSMAAQSGSDGQKVVAAEEEEDMVMPNYGTSSDADAEGEEYDEEVYHEAPAVIHHPSSGSDPQSKGGKSPTRTSQATINQQATFTTSPTPKAARQSLLSGIARASNEAIRAAEEKVGLAVTAYDWVDRHIRRLDADLQRSESSLLLGLRAGTEASRGVRDALGMRENQGGEGAGSTSYNRSNGTTSGGGAAGWEDDSMMSGQSTPMVSGLVGGGSATAGKRDKNAKNRSNNAAYSDGSDANASTTLLADMAIDPNEPKYCYCDQVSSGDMVACDNEDCPREWFHYHCVGLASPPKGRWYCLFCAPPGFKGSGSFPDDAPCLPPGYGPNKRSHLGSSHLPHGGGQNKKKKRKK